MNTRIKLFIKAFLISTIICCTATGKAQDADAIVARQIDSVRIANNIPSIAYGVIKNDSIVVVNTVGYRDILTKERSQSDDYYQIGSNTKAFTGFLAAKMVEDNLIKWDTKFFDLYPELKHESNSVYHEMTLKELLSNRARLINFNQPEEIMMIMGKYEKLISDSLSSPEKRYFLIKEILKSDPLLPYGESKDSYSNAGFIAASLMLEKVTEQSWEYLMLTLSKELKLGIHIGNPIDLGEHQPKGHINPKMMRLDIDKKLIPVQNPLQDELIPLNGFIEFLELCTPAGSISMNTNDFLKFLQLNINGINGKDNFLKSESYKQIFTTYPFYSMGWWIEPEENLRYSHRGSNMMFTSFAGISPDDKLGVVVMINAFDDNVVTQTINLLLKNYKEKY